MTKNICYEGGFCESRYQQGRAQFLFQEEGGGMTNDNVNLPRGLGPLYGLHVQHLRGRGSRGIRDT